MSAFEYRAAFLTQAIGMMLNDICWVACWWIYHQKFPVVNGWQFEDTMILFGLNCFAFGLFVTFLGGSFDISRMIYRGELDYYLTFPKNVLWHVALSNVLFSGVGDIVYGIGAFFVFADPSLEGVIIFMLAAIFAAIGMFSFMVIVHSISFFVGNFQEAAESIFWTLITFGIYPPSAFKGGLKLIICTVVPAWFVLIMPVELVRNFEWQNLAIVALFNIGMLAFAITLFNYGLKRYESGNLVQAKI